MERRKSTWPRDVREKSLERPGPAPRKERVLPVSDPASATDRFEQMVAKRFTGNQKELRDDGRPAYARLCLRVGLPKVHAFGRLEWLPPEKGAHPGPSRNRSQKGLSGMTDVPSTSTP